MPFALQPSIFHIDEYVIDYWRDCRIPNHLFTSQAFWAPLQFHHALVKDHSIIFWFKEWVEFKSASLLGERLSSVLATLQLQFI